MLRPDEENEDIKIRYEFHLNKSKSIDIKYVVAWTNGTYIPIPVFIYDKTLTCSFEQYLEREDSVDPFVINTSLCNSIPIDQKLDFGPVAQGHTHRRMLTLINMNPLPIFIDKIRVSISMCEGVESTNLVQLVPAKTIDIPTGLVKRHFNNEDKVFNKTYDEKEFEDAKHNGRSITDTSDFMLPPTSIVEFNVEVVDPKFMPETKCGDFESDIYFTSFQAPNFQVPISYQVLKADITLFNSDTVHFQPSIPGIRQSRRVRVNSNLEKPVYIKSVSSSNPQRVNVKILSHVLEPRTSNGAIEISTVAFDQLSPYLKMSKTDLFSYLTQNSKYLTELGSNQYDSTLTYFDIIAWQVEQKEWQAIETSPPTDYTSIITIETNMIQNITIPVKSVITRPLLLTQEKYSFDRIEVGTEKRGTITIHNPSPNPIEVSFHIAPSDFLDNLINELLDEENLGYWKQLCDKSTFFDPYGRKMCKEISEIKDLTPSNRKIAIDYFLKHYYKFLMNRDIDSYELKNFIAEQIFMLQSNVVNITKATEVQKPPVKKELEPETFTSGFKGYWKRIVDNFKSVFGFLSYSEPAKSHEHDEVVEEIKVRLTKMIDEAPPDVKQEFKNLMYPKLQSFFIEHKPNCIRDGNQEENEDCHEECGAQKFLIPGYSSMDYSCFHFHPSVLSNHTEAYLLIKNNLTYIYPLKLEGSSGKGVLKLTEVTLLPAGSTNKNLTVKAQPKGSKHDADLFYNLNLKSELFKVKAFEELSQNEVSEKLRTLLTTNERLTAKDLSLIRKYKKTFQITNVGNFPVEIQSITIGGHGTSFNGFSIFNNSGIYELVYQPDFQNSRVTETIVVKTKYSKFEFKVEAYIPMYLLKFIDSSFRISQIEDFLYLHYIIIFVMMAAAVSMLTNEILDYISYMKQKNLLVEVQRQNLASIQQNNLRRAALGATRERSNSLSEFVQAHGIGPAKMIDAKVIETFSKPPPIYQDTNSLEKEVKKLLNLKAKIDSGTRSSSVKSKSKASKESISTTKKLNKDESASSIKTDNRSAAKSEKPQQDKPSSAKSNKGKKQKEQAPKVQKKVEKQPKIANKPESVQKEEPKSVPEQKPKSKPASVKTPQKGKKKEEKPVEEPVKKQKPVETKETLPESCHCNSMRCKNNNPDCIAFGKAMAKAMKQGTAKQKQKKKQTKKHKEEAILVEKEAATTVDQDKPVKGEEKAEILQEEVKQSKKETKFQKTEERSKEKVASDHEVADISKPAKQNKPVKVAPKLSKSETVKSEEQPESNTEAKPSVKPKSEKSEVVVSQEVKKEIKPKEEEPQKATELVKGDEADVVESAPIESHSEVKEAIDKKVDKSPEGPQVSQPTDKSYNRQESSKTSVKSEANISESHRLSHRESKDSWLDQDDAGDYDTTKNYFPEDENANESEEKSFGRTSDRASEGNKRHSHTEESSGSYQKPMHHKKDHKSSHFAKRQSRGQGSGRYNQYYKNDYNDLKYYNKYQYYDYQGYDKRHKNPQKRRQGESKTNSYQDYKKGLMEQKNKQHYRVTKGYYGRGKNSLYGDKYNFQRYDPYRYQQESSHEGSSKHISYEPVYSGPRPQEPLRSHSRRDNYEADEDPNIPEGMWDTEEVDYPQEEEKYPQKEYEEDKYEEDKYEEDKEEHENEKDAFMEEEEGYHFNLFPEFGPSNNEFNLFAQAQDNIFLDDSLKFEFLDDPAQMEDDDNAGISKMMGFFNFDKDTQ